MKLRFTPLSVVLPTLLFTSVTVACDAHNDVVVSASVGENVPENNSKALTRKIYLDPETQEFRPENQRDLASEQQIRKLLDQGQKPQKSEGFAENTKSGVASAPRVMNDGTLIIDFNGQFDRPLEASIDDSGGIQAGHHLQLESSVDNNQLSSGEK